MPLILDQTRLKFSRSCIFEFHLHYQKQRYLLFTVPNFIKSEAFLIFGTKLDLKVLGSLAFSEKKLFNY